MIKSLELLISDLAPIITAIRSSSGICYLVGGSVRDYVLDLPLKDLDIEVHKISIDTLETILKQFGNVKLVGKKFGVLRIDGLDVDWSLPRKDSSGRKPDVHVDPNMNIHDACRRRDLTMNAMAIDITHVSNDFTIIDPYGGLNDIATKTLREVDATLFIQDPLRFYRVMHFIGRFTMQPSKSLNTLCSAMSLYDTTANAPLASERIYEEIKKLCMKSVRPSLGFRWLNSINRLKEIFPELYALVECIQRADYHPEGDAFEHSMQALDAAARYEKYTSDNEKLTLMFGALCHDLGKATTTTAEGRAHGHDKAGVPIAQTLMRKLSNNQSIEKSVAKLVAHHLLPFQFLKENVKAKSYKRLANKLAPEATMRELGLIALFDWQGRNGSSQIPLDTYHDLFDTFISKAQQASVVHGPEAPVLLGRHLIDSIPEGKAMGTKLAQAYEIQIDEEITDWQELKRRVLKK